MYSIAVVMLKVGLCFLFVLLYTVSRSNAILIPMDEGQKNHLKAYGIAYFVLQKGADVDWLLNYRGGSFLVNFTNGIENECIIRGISFEILSDARTNSIFWRINGNAWRLLQLDHTHVNVRV